MSGESTLWVCAYDPLLFGVDPVAAEMQSALERIVMTQKAYLVTNTYLERHIELHYPASVVRQTIIIPSSVAQRLGDRWNVNLSSSQTVTEVGNVGGTLMLPLAATLGRTIVLYGMDGFVRQGSTVDLPHANEFDLERRAPKLARSSASSLRAQEMEVFESATHCLVQAMLSNGHRIFLAKPSLNRGLVNLPVLSALREELQ
jgi:hypothetical protein